MVSTQQLVQRLTAIETPDSIPHPSSMSSFTRDAVPMMLMHPVHRLGETLVRASRELLHEERVSSRLAVEREVQHRAAVLERAQRLEQASRSIDSDDTDEGAFPRGNRGWGAPLDEVARMGGDGDDAVAAMEQEPEPSFPLSFAISRQPPIVSALPLGLIQRADAVAAAALAAGQPVPSSETALMDELRQVLTEDHHSQFPLVSSHSIPPGQVFMLDGPILQATGHGVLAAALPTNPPVLPHGHFLGFNRVLRIHFFGHGERFDEALPANSSRLVPFRTRTRRTPSIYTTAVRDMVNRSGLLSSAWNPHPHSIHLRVRCLWLASSRGAGMLRVLVPPTLTMQELMSDFCQVFTLGAGRKTAARINQAEAVRYAMARRLDPITPEENRGAGARIVRTAAATLARAKHDIASKVSSNPAAQPWEETAGGSNALPGITTFLPEMTVAQCGFVEGDLVDILYSPAEAESAALFGPSSRLSSV